MEGQENKVVEKRIKPGIIRRRARAPKKAEAPSAAPTLKEEVALKEASLPSKEPKVKAEKVSEQEIVAASETLKKEAPTELKANKPEPALAEAPSLQEKEAQRIKSSDQTGLASKAPVVKGPRALPDGPPVGTIIDLAKTKASAVKVEEGKDLKTPEEDLKKSKSRRGAKAGKGSKASVEVEGFGRVRDVRQLARLSTRSVADRVFQPAKTGKRRKTRRKDGQKTQLTQPKAAKRVVKMEEETITVGELASQLGIKANEIIKKLMDLGSMVTVNEPLDEETTTLVAHDYDWEVKQTGFQEESVLEVEEDQEKDLVSRPPVVTVMGHVDHGKTSLLDAIRASQVAEGEAGGITQHIGSYRISLGPGRDITFLDTPGHEAFTAMRARGASVTDIVILVVAADDGVMPQTLEALNHAKAAGVPIIVAINKMDKPEANPDNVKRQLSEHGLLAEDWGGEALFAQVSAKTKEGIDELLESVFLQAEILELKANPNKKAKGVIVEARVDKGRGPVATVLVQEGTLKVGDYVVAGESYGRIRAMLNERGRPLSEATPSVPAEVLGFDSPPPASEVFQAVADEKSAKQVVEHRRLKKLKTRQVSGPRMSLEDLFTKIETEDLKELGVILKADVQGSLEAVQNSLEKLPKDKVKIRFLHAAVGGITESDVTLAEASNGIIIGFNVRPDTKAIGLAESHGIEIKVYKVIYELIDEVKMAMEGLLAPTLKEVYLGRAEVRQVFTVSKVGSIAGAKVIDGRIVRNAQVRLLRDNVIIHEGKLSSLKRFKEDAKEVKEGFECGMGIENYDDLKEGDLIECYEIEEVKTKL